jgi:hypothetical protein
MLEVAAEAAVEAIAAVVVVEAITVVVMVVEATVAAVMVRVVTEPTVVGSVAILYDVSRSSPQYVKLWCSLHALQCTS